MVRERRDVLAALAQRRQADRKDAQAVVQILPEPSRLDLVLEATVRRRDHAHVDGPGAGVADGPDLALLEHAQELRLERAARLADLVEEERAAVGDVEEALPVGDGAGEGAAAVAEELALEDALGERRTVDRHEEPVAPVARRVDGARDELLAGAGFALDEHRGGRRRHPRDQREDVPNRGAVADDLVPRPGFLEIRVLGGEPLVRAAELVDEAGVLARQMERLDRTAQRQTELLALPRLGDVAVDAARVDRPHDRVDVGVAGEHDAVGVGPDLHRPREELDTAHDRHPLVRDDDGRVVRFEELEPARAALGRQHRELVAVVELEGAEDVRLVVDQDHGKAPVIELHASPMSCRSRPCQAKRRHRRPAGRCGTSHPRPACCRRRSARRGRS